jgi:ACS family tartrate transporter-like MFS transporter
MTENRVFAKCAWRLVPLVLLIYLINYLDRVNVGFAGLTMKRDLGFSDEIFGFGAGVLFLGYSALQVPANAVLQRFGTHRWLAAIMFVWGLLSAATAFVTTPLEFHVLRFALGAAEAGFYPGILLYLTRWFPQSYLARCVGIFMTGTPFAFVLGGPVSSFVLEMDGMAGLHGWQWLFIVEGLPASLLAFAVHRLLPDEPAAAPWLTADEKRLIAARLAVDQPQARHGDFLAGLLDRRIWALGLAAGCVAFGLYGMQIWLPQIVQSLGFSSFATGFVVASSFLLAAAGMMVCGLSSDRRRERAWHIALPVLLAIGGLVAASFATRAGFVLAGLTVGLVGILSCEGPLFSLPKAFLSGAAAASGIAFFNTIASLGRFLGPYVIGVLRGNTGDYGAGMLATAAVLATSIVIVLAFRRSPALRRSTHEVANGLDRGGRFVEHDVTAVEEAHGGSRQ